MFRMLPAILRPLKTRNLNLWFKKWELKTLRTEPLRPPRDWTTLSVRRWTRSPYQSSLYHPCRRTLPLTKNCVMKIVGNIWWEHWRNKSNRVLLPCRFQLLVAPLSPKVKMLTEMFGKSRSTVETVQQCIASSWLEEPLKNYWSVWWWILSTEYSSSIAKLLSTD